MRQEFEFDEDEYYNRSSGTNKGENSDTRPTAPAIHEANMTQNAAIIPSMPPGG